MITQIIELNATTFTIKIGRNAKENWDLIDSSSPDDVWFHLESMASPHVVISRPEPSILIPKALIYKCGIVCKKYSSCRTETNVSVIYTEIQNISKGKEIGSVYTKNTKKILV